MLVAGSFLPPARGAVGTMLAAVFRATECWMERQLGDPQPMA